MITAWEWVKERAEYVYALACSGLAAWSFSTGDSVGAWINIGVGAALFVLLKVLKPRRQQQEAERARTWEQAEMELMVRLGAEPVPIPGEDSLHTKDCYTCKRWRETR